MKNLDKLITENIIFILLPIIVIGAGIYYSYTNISEAISNNSVLFEKKTELENVTSKLEQLKRKLEQQEAREKKDEKDEKKTESGKIIYEVLEQQFSPEASFGIMFENMLANITNSGVRIRSIDYNYEPANDKVLQTNAPGYNACELSFTAVGNYSQLQTFFKNSAKETYLSSIYEIYIEPYDKDKTILVTKFKIRLYTKTVRG